MTLPIHNLLTDIPPAGAEEDVISLLSAPRLDVRRIVSRGHTSPPGFWYDQEETECVLVLSGSAGLQFEGETSVRTLVAGSYVEIPPHVRHRIEWTDPDQPTIWLTIHHVGDVPDRSEAAP